MQEFETLLIGGTGFIGEHLLRELSSDSSRIAVFHSGKSIRVSSLKVFYFCDNNGECFFDTIVKQASRIVFLVQPNPELLKRTLSLIGDDESKTLLYASSLMLYKGGKTPQKETDELDPVTAYAKQKREEERILSAFSLDHKNARIIIARLGNVYGGVKNRGLTGLIFESLFRQPKEITLSPDGSQVRDFIFIDDVVKALRSLLMSSRSGLMTVNVSTGKGTSLLELVRKIEKVSGKKVHYHFGPDVNETLSVIGNNSSLLSHIGWRPSVSMEQGLRDTLKQYMIKK